MRSRSETVELILLLSDGVVLYDNNDDNDDDDDDIQMELCTGGQSQSPSPSTDNKFVNSR